MNIGVSQRYLWPFFLLSAVIVYLLGPKKSSSYPTNNPTIQPLNLPLETLEAHIAAKEKQIANLKTGNQARIIWADSVQKTPYSVVYLHGFSASSKEGDPIHQNFAKRYGCNLYLARLAGHGINDPDAFANLTPSALINSAKEALAIGQLLGEKVIVMSGSTGATLGIYLGANNPGFIHSHFMYSPNIDLHDPTSVLLTQPWGVQLTQLVLGSKYRTPAFSEACKNYWTCTYRIEGLICLKNLLQQTMTTATFAKIEHPVFMGYWYKNEQVKDKVVSIAKMRQFFEEISTPSANKQARAFADVDSHCIQSGLQSKDVQSVQAATFAFAENVLRLTPVTADL